MAGSPDIRPARPQPDAQRFEGKTPVQAGKPHLGGRIKDVAGKIIFAGIGLSPFSTRTDTSPSKGSRQYPKPGEEGYTEKLIDAAGIVFGDQSKATQASQEKSSATSISTPTEKKQR